MSTNEQNKKVNKDDIIKNNATIVLVELSNLDSKNCGIVMSPIFKYFGTKYNAAKINANEEVTSQAIIIKPFL